MTARTVALDQTMSQVRSPALNANDEPFGQLTIAELLLVARARGLHLPVDADRPEIVAL